MNKSLFSSLLVWVALSGCLSAALAQDATPSSPAPSTPPSFRFGRDYLRARINYVYLPQESSKKRSFSLTIRTQNKQGLEFKSVYDPPTQTKVDELEGIIVIDHVALNTKAPLRITQQVREQLDVTRWVNLIQNVVSNAASAFTGGAARSVSALTQQTGAVNTVVSAYEQATVAVKSNDWTLFDDTERANMDLGQRFSAFSSPKEGFLVREMNGKPFSIHPALIDGQSLVLISPNASKKDVFMTEMRSLGNRKNFPSPYAIRLSYQTPLAASSTGQSAEQKVQWVKGEARQQSGTSQKIETIDLYPAGTTPFVILQFERYNPYPDINTHPEGVPGIAPHFEALNTIFLNNFPAEEPSDVAAKKDEIKSINKLVNVEGLKLVDTLQKLTDAGDLSLDHAAVIMRQFCDRARNFGRPTGFVDERLMAVARRFETQAQAANQNTPAPVAPTP